MTRDLNPTSAGVGPGVREVPLIAHIVYRFDTGGLENGLVNLINHMPADAYRHVVIALTEVTAFAQRIQRSDVRCIALHKPPGHALRLYPRLWRLLRELRPDIVHTRNLAALECVAPAWAAGVPVRVHGEHGRDVEDLDGRNRKYQWIRRLYRPWVSHYVALSTDLGAYLRERVGVAAADVSQIYNGVDTARFRPAGAVPAALAGCPFDPAQHWLVGTVGRMQAVKDQPTLARAFVQMVQTLGEHARHARLVMVGDGPLRAQVQAIVDEAGLSQRVWLPGERQDVADVMRALSCFALPSRAEGISNTILEAMASGLPVVATRVGGNAELVSEGRTGHLVPPGDPAALATALADLLTEPRRSMTMGQQARDVAERQFSLQAMVARYQAVYDQQLRRVRSPKPAH